MPRTTFPRVGPAAAGLAVASVFAAALALLTGCTLQGSWDILLGLTRGDTGDAPWFDPTFVVRQKLAFQNSASSQALASFPVLVTLTPARFDYLSAKPDGSDLRFVDADGTTELNYECNIWSPGGTSTFWVNVPVIDAGSLTDHIWLYYGNSGAGSVENIPGTWNSAYRGVWHLGALADSTGNGNDGINSGTTTVPGVIGSGRDFNGGAFVRVPDDPSLRITGGITLEAWCYKRVVDEQAVVAKYNPPGTRSYLLGFNYTVNPNGPYALFSNNGNYVPGGFLEFPAAEDLDTWMHVAAVFDTTSVRLYVNGAPAGQQAAGFSSLFDSSENLILGAYDNGSGGFFDGILDEVRVSATARSADWIHAQYLSMTDVFIDFQAPETQ